MTDTQKILEKIIIERFKLGLVKINYKDSELPTKGLVALDIYKDSNFIEINAKIKYEYYKELRDKALKEMYYDSYADYLKAKKEYEMTDPVISKKNYKKIR